MPLIRANAAPAPRPRASYRYGGGRDSRAIQAAIESANCRAFLLSCEHVTYIDVQLAYDVWRPKSNRLGRFYYCETCSDWKHAKPRPKPVPIPETPLF